MPGRGQSRTSRARAAAVASAASVVLCAALGSVAAAAGAGAAAQELAANSFKPPFDNYDGLGKREIPNWQYGGTAVANANFIRLTPDRASKRGWMWNTAALEAPDWTATLRFRVSGQGRDLFGDGFALWFTTDANHRDGALHGYTDSYTGFGILFDTFRNTESGHVHKDVSLLSNNGTPKNADGVVGCDGDFRFHEGRDDFDVSRSKSAAKISFRAGRVSVELDLRNTGDWIKCIDSAELPDLQPGWARGAHLGITSSTGQLADNHDILSLMVSPADVVLNDKAEEPEPAAVSAGNQQLDAAIAAAVRREMKPLTDKVSHLHHHVEHQLSSVHDTTKNTLKKIQEQEDGMLKRIEELERRMEGRVESKVADTVGTHVNTAMESRIRSLEEALNSKIAGRLESEVNRAVGSQVESAVSNRMSDVQSLVAASGGGWVWPFVLLLCIIVGVVGYAGKVYRDAKKSHLL